MKKSGIILGLLVMLWVLNAGTAFASPVVAPVEWYFGDNPNSDYEAYVAGPISQFFVPATMVANVNLPAGYFEGCSAQAMYNGVPFAWANSDNWYFGTYYRYPNSPGTSSVALPAGTYTDWNVYIIMGMNGWVWPDYSYCNVPDGTYQSVKEYCNLNHWIPDPTQPQGGILFELHPLNNFIITVGEQESTVPEPATLTLFGIGTVAAAFIRRRVKA